MGCGFLTPSERPNAFTASLPNKNDIPQGDGGVNNVDVIVIVSQDVLSSVVVRTKPRPRAPHEALCPRHIYPRVVDPGRCPPCDMPQVDCTDILPPVLHRYHRLPNHPQLGCHAPRRGCVGRFCREALLCLAEIRSL